MVAGLTARHLTRRRRPPPSPAAPHAARPRCRAKAMVKTLKSGHVRSTWHVLAPCLTRQQRRVQLGHAAGQR